MRTLSGIRPCILSIQRSDFRCRLGRYIIATLQSWQPTLDTRRCRRDWRHSKHLSWFLERRKARNRLLGRIRARHPRRWVPESIVYAWLLILSSSPVLASTSNPCHQVMTTPNASSVTISSGDGRKRTSQCSSISSIHHNVVGRSS